MNSLAHHYTGINLHLVIISILHVASLSLLSTSTIRFVDWIRMHSGDAVSRKRNLIHALAFRIQASSLRDQISAPFFVSLYFFLHLFNAFFILQHCVYDAPVNLQASIHTHNSSLRMQLAVRAIALLTMYWNCFSIKLEIWCKHDLMTRDKWYLNFVEI